MPRAGSPIARRHRASTTATGFGCQPGTSPWSRNPRGCAAPEPLLRWRTAGCEPTSPAWFPEAGADRLPQARGTGSAHRQAPRARLRPRAPTRGAQGDPPGDPGILRGSLTRPMPSLPMLSRGSDAISPTAHYTGHVWVRNGLSHPELATREGRVMFDAAPAGDDGEPSTGRAHARGTAARPAPGARRPAYPCDRGAGRAAGHRGGLRHVAAGMAVSQAIRRHVDLHRRAIFQGWPTASGAHLAGWTR